jgi:flagellar biosynthesis protein FlhF
MLVRKFYASSARHALRLVREALGGEALILSNRRTANGIEIIAVAPQEVEAVTQTASPAQAAAAVPDDAQTPEQEPPTLMEGTLEPHNPAPAAPAPGGNRTGAPVSRAPGSYSAILGTPGRGALRLG